ncbi:MAG: germination protein YpeB [Acutalibacteraceae bacterium]|nr:germination protein YpeB [Acutalibacteraceae bacterium]
MVKKRTLVKIISFLSAAILTAVCFLIKEKSNSNKYLVMLENQYSNSFEQLNSSLNNITSALEKIVYATSAKKISSLSVEIFSEAELAKEALSNLPTGESGLSTVYKFLSQVGNYAISVSKNITSENTVTDAQRGELKILYDTAKTVTSAVNDAGIDFNTPDGWAQSVEEKLNGAVSEESLASSLTQLEENMTDYPTLIYDGPYSDHILESQPLMIINADECSKEDALLKAQSVLGDNFEIKFEDMQGGKIECYRFGNDSVSVAVSRYGGYAVYMRKNRTVGENLLSYEQALSRAKKFLEQMQITSMIDTYYYTDAGVCVINFAYLDGQTVCYTDLIKVGVAMDTGEIMLLETSGYLTNHTDRAFKVPEHTVDEAAEKISSDLEIEKTSMTLIPTDSGGEVRCYEFLCLSEENEEILVYINVQDLTEEQIYILIKTDGGSLVK